MTKPDKRQKKEERPSKMAESQPKRRCGRPEKPLRINDTPENVARALWRERATRFSKNQKNQGLNGA